jgi:hypothetical protein
MASRPPDPNGPSEDDARTRFFVINATRLVGVAMVVMGLLALQGKAVEIPAVASYILIAFGLFDVFWMPLILARKWHTPPQ